MEQKCSPDKIISLHFQRCSGYCPNASSCYHIQKKESGELIETQREFKIKCLESGATIHESVCDYQHEHKDLLNLYPNYNITISSDIVSLDIDLHKHRDQLQITVYNVCNLIDFKDFQKLFLINDIPSLEKFRGWLGHSYYGKLHFLIDQNRIELKDIVGITEEFNEKASEGQTLDSCLTSYLINGECPYNNNNYIDINYDLTLRKCPYEKEGIVFNQNTPVKELFNFASLPKCNYTKYFEEN